MKKILLIASIFTTLIAGAQITVTNIAPYNNTTYLVNNVLSGNGVTASNITFTSADANQIGFFKDGLLGAPNLGVDSGIVISSGDVNDIPVGGNQPDVGQYAGAGDNDLLTIAQTVRPGITSTEDAAILEFDFTVTGDTFEFQFVFASEEYLTYVNTDFNDIFAFFLSGPGITGPYASPAGFPNGAVNVAQVPGTTDPITISTIHPGLNSQFYIDNPAGSNNDFNGFTTVMTAKYPVNCGGTYHFKFAIADCQDDFLDTGVFIKAGSLSSSGVSISANTTFANNTIAEGCGNAEICIVRSDTTFNDTISLNVLGNMNTSEYSTINTTQIFPPGQDTIKFNVGAFVDNITEGVDTLIIEIAGNTGCNMVTIHVEDYTPMELTVSDSANICSELGESATLWASVDYGRPPYSYYWNNGVGFADTAIVSPEETIYYTATVTDMCGNSIESSEVPVWVQCQIIPTNVFTPNGDGMNDYFTLINLDDYPNPTVKIYNRWGKLVFEKTGYQNDWDGDELPAGTYYYIVLPNSEKFEYGSESRKEEFRHLVKGYVELLR